MSFDDQTPENSDALVYTDRRRRGGGSGGYGFIIFFILLLILATVGSGWLYFNQVAKNASLRQEVVQLNKSMAIVREALQITDDTITDENKERNKKLSEVQSEIKKLWALVNKKQKTQIQLLMSRTASNTEALKVSGQGDDTLKDSLVKFQEEHKNTTAELSKKLKDLKDKVGKLPQIASLNKKVGGNKEVLTSLKNSRSALNSRVAKIQQEISLMRSKLLTLESNQPIPSHDLENSAQ